MIRVYRGGRMFFVWLDPQGEGYPISLRSYRPSIYRSRNYKE